MSSSIWTYFKPVCPIGAAAICVLYLFDTVAIAQTSAAQPGVEVQSLDDVLAVPEDGPPAAAAAASDAAVDAPPEAGDPPAAAPPAAEVPAVADAPAAAPPAAEPPSAVAEPEPAPSAAVLPEEVVKSVCFTAPLGDLQTSAKVLALLGFERKSEENGVAVHVKGEAAVLLASASVAGAAAGRETAQCTFVMEDFAQADADKLAVKLIGALDFVEKDRYRANGVLIREFGTKGGGISGPPLGAVVTLSDELAETILQRPAGGLSILAHPVF